MCHYCKEPIDKLRTEYIITVIPRTSKMEKYYYHMPCFENRRRYVTITNGRTKHKVIGKYIGRARNGYIVLG